MHIDAKHGMLFVGTKMGFLLVYELSTASLLSRAKISDKPIFTGTRNSKTDGLLVITGAGQVTACSIDESKLVQCL